MEREYVREQLYHLRRQEETTKGIFIPFRIKYMEIFCPMIALTIILNCP